MRRLPQSAAVRALRGPRHPLSLAAVALSVPLALASCAKTVSDYQAVYSGAGAEMGQEESYRQRGAEHFAAGRYGLAIKYFHLAIETDASSVESLNGLAASYDHLGRFDLAMRYYERALAIDPDSPQTLNNMGYSYLLQGKEDLAVVYLSEASKAAPQQEVIVANLRSAESRLKTANAAPRERLAVASETPVTQTRDDQGMHVERRKANEYRLRTQSATVQPVERGSLADDHRSALRPSQPVPEGRPEQIVLQSAPEATPARQRTAKATPRQEMRRAPVVEVSNGAGRRRMASRMRGFFTEQGVPVQRLTNADHFAHQTSTVFYRPGWEAEAEILASYLPVTVALAAEPDQLADLRLELGGDLLAFDASLIERSDEPVEKQPEQPEEDEQEPKSDLTS